MSSDRRSSPQLGYALLCLLAGTLLGWKLTSRPLEAVHDPHAAPRQVAARGDLAEAERSTIGLFQKASPSVVHVTNLAVRRDRFRLNLYEIPQGSGSGFVWDDAGHVVTNYHVIHGGQAFEVTLNDNSSWHARVVGFDADNDLAVLKVDAPPSRLPPLDLGTSRDLMVGQQVLAIGNPFGLDQTLTTGIIGGLGREIQAMTGKTIQGAIQTDAAINPGNSGGPLLDSAGRLIGVNTAILSPSGSYSGVGFAVPVDTVNRVVPAVIRGTEQIGLGIRPAEDSLSQRLGLEGVLVLEVMPGLGAADAGLRGVELDAAGRIERMGDVIVAVDGNPIHELDDLFKILDQHAAGDEVQVTIERPEGRISARVRLQPLN